MLFLKKYISPLNLDLEALCNCNSNIIAIANCNRFFLFFQLLSIILKRSRRQTDLFCHFLYESGSPLANGKMHLHSSVKRKLAEEKGYVFDKRLRYNVRQNESNCRFRDIVVRKEEGFTHVLLSSQTTDNNGLTPEVRTKKTHECCAHVTFFI